MATKLKEVDAVIVGLGWTGGILAKELAEAGLKVVALERGAMRSTDKDYAVPNIRDELRYVVRHDLMQNTARDTLTVRNNPTQEALPMRRLGSFLPGEVVGGSAVHWSGHTWRWTDMEFKVRSLYEERYGKSFVPADMTIQDWGITYAELEPYYDKFEYTAAVSGKAGNIKGQIQAGGNPFEGARERDYPTPPLKQGYAQELFTKAASGMGLHPFPRPSANISIAYTNPYGCSMAPCTYCGFCEWFGCANYSKASPQTCVLPALVREPIMASIFVTSICNVSGSTSTNAGTMPLRTSGAMSLEKVSGDVITSSPRSQPRRSTANHSADVPLFTMTACCFASSSAPRRSNSATSGPMASRPSCCRTRTTASISRWSCTGPASVTVGYRASVMRLLRTWWPASPRAPAS